MVNTEHGPCAIDALKWHDPVVGEKLVFIDFIAYRDFVNNLWSNFAKKGDYAEFLAGINRLQYFWEWFGKGRQEQAYILDNLEQTIKLFKQLDIKFSAFSKNAEEAAGLIFGHEFAHASTAEAWGIGNLIRLSWARVGELYYPQPYLQLRMSDLRRLAKEKRLMRAVADLLMAPEKEGMGYQAETDLAKLLYANVCRFEE